MCGNSVASAQTARVRRTGAVAEPRFYVDGGLNTANTRYRWLASQGVVVQNRSIVVDTGRTVSAVGVGRAAISDNAGSAGCIDVKSWQRELWRHRLPRLGTREHGFSRRQRHR